MIEASRRQGTLHRYVGLLTGGGLAVLGWHGPWHVAVAAWLFPVLLMRFARQSRVLPGFATLWLVQAVGGLAWLYQTDLLARLPAAVSVLVVTAIAALLALPFLLDRLLAPRLKVVGSLVFPLGWVSVEFLLAQITPFGAFVVLGTTQYDNLPLIQIASVAGAYGVSFLVTWCAPIVNQVRERTPGWPRQVLTYAAVLVTVLAAGGARLTFFPSSAPLVRVAAISPSRAAAEKRAAATAGLRARYGSFQQVLTRAPQAERQAIAGVTDELLARSEQEAAAGAKIIAWSETGAWTMQRDLDALLARVRALTAKHHVYLVAGLSVYADQAPYLRNKTIMVTPDGRVAWDYDKTHPTPMEALTPGSGRVPVIATTYGDLAGAICYDADFPALMRQAAGRAGLMIVPSRDWQGMGEAHAQRAVFRAVENGYTLLRPADEGLSEAVDPHGRVLATADSFATDQVSMVAYLRAQVVRTVYGTVGDLFSWLCLTGLAVVIVVSAIRPARRWTAVVDENDPARRPKGRRGIRVG
ncbi:nitrilase-related carbon-nitrogen hydrolase [Nonomuraea fuscirosea]|uniref:nitrilase-related carbon-nitrogen hydrolase n=1 Tax=Nonomuraea fuscirosea TaxID=1291556 RepID=UPI003428B70E